MKKVRAGVVLVQGRSLALIRRVHLPGGGRPGREYYVFPGGKVEPGELPEEAAVREALEEMGLDVQIQRLLAEVRFKGQAQYYFLAEVRGGQFGTGQGPEMQGLKPLEHGTYTPVWEVVDGLQGQAVLPAGLLALVKDALDSGWPKQPVLIVDEGE
jgi:8-oxo-dGTP diphosphatase